jgi:aryl-alcohol dehydrogenase-like predicted oxidoreductase
MWLGETCYHKQDKHEGEKTMQTRRFGKTELQITPIGFGAWAIGGGNWEYAWGAQDDKESIAAIHKALDLGINWIDTAPVYGLGHSEKVVAEALKGRAEKPLIFTKCSLVWDNHRKVSSTLKADSVRREVEESLRRLQVDTIDLYQIHWPEPENEIEEGWQVLAELKAAGKVRHIGVSNFSVEQMERIKPYAPIETLQPPYSLVKPQVEEEILPYCQREDIGVIVYSPMYSGLLTGKMSAERIAAMPEDDWRKRDSEFQEPRLSRNLALQALLVDIGAKHHSSAAAVSIAWTLLNPAVTAAIVGGRSAEQVEGFIAGAKLQLDSEDKTRISDFVTQNP